MAEVPWDTLREISLEGAKPIGKGRNGQVYDIGLGKIVKLCPLEAYTAACREQQNARAASELGVPTPVVYELVRCGGGLGLVFDKAVGRSLRDVIAGESEQIEVLVPQAARLLKELHSREVAPGDFPSMAEVYHERAEGLGEYLTGEEISLLHRMIDAIPLRHAFLHGDFHRGNLLVEKGKLCLIDMADCAWGHPFYDVLGVYTLGVGLVRAMPPQAVKAVIGWEPAVVQRVWQVFSESYFVGCSPQQMDELASLMEAYAPLRQLTFLNIVTGIPEEERRRLVASAREGFFPRAEEAMQKYAPFLERM